MSSETTQAGRFLSVKTPLQTPEKKEVLLMNSFTASEKISRLFSLDLLLLAERSKAAFVRARDIVGKKVTVSMTLRDKSERHFNGIVNRFIEGERDELYHYYHAEVVPWLWLLTMSSDCRIFQDMDVPAIIEKIFGDLRGLHPDLVSFRNALRGDFTKRDYCVQYRETDFNFVSRLMEEEGIFYFFEHEENKHTLVLANATDNHNPLPSQPQVRYHGAGMGDREDTITAWQGEEAMRPGQYGLRDYHFEMPKKTLTAVAPSKLIVGENSQEVYDYPGGYAKWFNKPGERLKDVEADAQRVVELRMEEEEIPSKVFSGSSHCRAMRPGFRFELTGHFQDDDPYVLTSVQHAAVQSPSYFSGETIGVTYHNSFTCIPHEFPFRPSRTSLKPVMQGPQTAVVVGKQGEEIFTDKYGRVKVKFHWDRDPDRDENSSCWIRVGQAWAGNRWGAFFWPRIGQEVIVDFLEGDPDQPIIVSSVYNSDQMPPYLGNGPDSKHKNDNKISGIKTNTTKGGQGFNELRFDDTKDKEQVFIHAERNMDTRVKSDSMENVGGNRHLTVGGEKDGKKFGDQRELIYQDKHLHVKRHHVEHIGGNMELLVGKGDEGGGNLDVVIEKKKSELIEGDNDFHVKGERKEKIDGATSLTVGGSQQEKVGQKHALEAGQEIHLKAGMKVILEAGVQLTIKGPGGFVDIGPSGVTIQGIMVLINSGGAAGAGSGSSPQEPVDPKEAKPTKPTPADGAKTGQKSAPS